MQSERSLNVENVVREVLRDVLGLSAARVAAFTADTPLFGSLPELDSLAVAGVLTEIEDRLGILIEDDEVDGEMLETFGGADALRRGPDQMIDHYDWPGGREAMLRFGPADGPVVVAVLPLFEEANRTRAVTVAILRALGDRGIAGALPDLPGTGESLVALADTSLADWRSAFAAAVASLGQPVHAMTARGGALVEAEADLASRWHLTPVAGEDLVRDLFRMRAIADPGAPRDFDPLAPSPEGPPVELAGNLISRQMLCELIAATPRETGATRVVRLGVDRRIANLALPDSPPWRRAEPQSDPALVARLADDLADWVRACAG